MEAHYCHSHSEVIEVSVGLEPAVGPEPTVAVTSSEWAAGATDSEPVVAAGLTVMVAESTRLKLANFKLILL
ncbi:hypothetical protein F0562_025242 [Nyssa sinensis]|uniref:Uncharacterized protein n=1 Tax=Nyssa sinensis TaxID=561372 RepID=A0A5J5BF07_9ASTE|nr:hypothetical protein F0562_025242 [Nyssa sinensis]